MHAPSPPGAGKQRGREERCPARRYWTVGLDSIAVAGVVQTVTARTAILDSGTTAILVGADDASAIHAVRRPSLAAAPRAAHATCAAHAHAETCREVELHVPTCEDRGVQRSQAEHQRRLCARHSQGQLLMVCLLVLRRRPSPA